MSRSELIVDADDLERLRTLLSEAVTRVERTVLMVEGGW